MKKPSGFCTKSVALCSIILLTSPPSLAGDDDWPWEDGNNPFETKNELSETFFEETLRELNPEVFDEPEQETEQTVTIETPPSWPPLHKAAATGTFQEVLGELTQAPENIHSQDHLGQTPLHLAAGRGDYDITLLLLQEKAKPNARNEYGQTPLGFAIIGGNIPVIELLLRYGAEINSRDRHNRTPLYWAIRRGNPEVVRCLTQPQEVPPPRNQFILPRVFKQIEEDPTNPALPAPPLWAENTGLHLPELPTPSEEPPSINPLRDSIYQQLSIEDLIGATPPPTEDEPPAKRFCRDGSA